MDRLKNDFLDIVAVIVRHMTEDEGVALRDSSIIEGLLKEGYDLLEIDDALSWLESLTPVGDGLGLAEFWPGFRGLRSPSREEKAAMTPEAFGYLSKLCSSGYVDENLREAILEKVVELDIRGFGIEQMKTLVGIILYSRNNEMEDGPEGWAGRAGRGSLPH